MPYSVGLVIRRGLKEVERTIIQVHAANRKQAILAAEERIDSEVGPDLWSKAVAVTEAYSTESFLAA